MANLSNINNKFLVTTGGNVGINTTSPGQKLVVTGNIGTSGSVLFDDNQVLILAIAMQKFMVQVVME